MQLIIRRAGAADGISPQTFRDFPVRIGRNPHADVCFHDSAHETVSWDHATIEVRSGAAFLQDVGSKNGTFLNNKRIDRRTRLKIGDTIALGQTGPQLIIEAIDAKQGTSSTGGEALTPQSSPDANPQTSLPPPQPAHDAASAPRPLLALLKRQSGKSIMFSAAAIVLVAAISWTFFARQPNERSESTLVADSSPAVASDLAGIDPTVRAVRSTSSKTGQHEGQVTYSSPAAEAPSQTTQLVAATDEPEDSSDAAPPSGSDTVRKREEAKDAAVDSLSVSSPRDASAVLAARIETTPELDRVRIINEARDYVVGSLDPPLTQYVELSARLKTLQRVRQQWTEKFLALPEESRGPVWSGRALNHFLQLCGNIARRHQFLSKQLRDEKDQLQRMFDADDLSDEDRNQLTEHLQRVTSRLRILEEIEGSPVFTESDRLSLNLKRGTSQEALAIDADGSPRKNQWNVFVTLPGANFGEAQNRVATLHTDFLASFEHAGEPDLELGLELLQAIEELDTQFYEYRLRYSRGDLANKQSGLFTAQLYRAKHLIEQLRIDIVAMMMAESPDQVFLGDAYEGDTVESLIAYADRNSLTFTPANQLERPVYEKVYRVMVRYYLTLYALSQAFDENGSPYGTVSDDDQGGSFMSELTDMLNDALASLGTLLFGQ